MKATFVLFYIVLCTHISAQDQLKLAGLEKPVEIITDQWGVPHIYAQTEHDLFLPKVSTLLAIVCFSLKCGADRLPEP
nr:penicillin acylase family protein [Haliscomenobacter sp.]